MTRETALQVLHLRKHFGPTIALDGVSLSVPRGEVHALLGENGAGKSTLVKLLSGLVRPDAGTISVFGEHADIYDPKVSHRLGIRTAFQEISLVKDLTVAENFAVMEEPLDGLGMIRKRQTEAMVADKLRDLRLGTIDVRTDVFRLDLPTRQKIEIARAVSHSPSILLLDEPTSSLSSNDVDWLGVIIEQLKAAGTTIIFISHRLQEVRRFCTALTILRNGKAVGSHAIHDITDDKVIELMIGRTLSAAFPSRPVSQARSASESAALSTKDLTTADGVNGVSLSLWPGRVLGLGGLDGMGQRELFLTLFGLNDVSSGTISVRGQQVRLRSPADAINLHIGISMVPEDRKTEGLFLELDGTQNITLPTIERFARFGLILRSLEIPAVEKLLDLVQVTRRALWSLVREFSGGNQQKIVIAKWLLTGSRVLLLYDPTRGVDVGTKAEIYRLVREFATSGGAVLFYSTDIPELVNLCDEVAVIYRGRVTEVLAGDEISETRIMAAAIGTTGVAASPCFKEPTETSSKTLAERVGERYFKPAHFQKLRGTLVAIGVFAVALALLAIISPAWFSYYNVSTVTGSAGALVLAGIGETIVVIGGGLDLSVGAVITLVNVLLVTAIGPLNVSTVPYTILATVLAIGVGATIGAINGLLIGYLRLQSIVVTLGTMFIVQGAVLLTMNSPGGEVANDFSMIMVGDVIPNLLPAPIVVILLAVLVWLYLKRTRFGVALYAVGSDPASAIANRVDRRLITLLAYILAGAFFGWAGLFLTANIGAGDPTIGAPMLLKVFTVVVLGGTAIGGGRGGCVGTVFGALTLTIIVNIILVLGIREYYAPIVEGVVLVLAALGFSISRDSPVVAAIRRMSGTSSTSSMRPPRAAPIRLQRASGGMPSIGYPNWFVRNAHTLRLVLPSYALLVVVIAITAVLYGTGFRYGDYLRTLITFGSFLAILGLGQGAVVLVGGLDLSVVWSITLAAVIAATPSCGAGNFCFGSQQALWPIPIALAVGVIIGFVNGCLVVGFRLSPIVATLAVGGVLEGVALLYNLGAQGGGVPTALKSFVTELIGPFPLIIWLFPVFIVIATLLLNRSSFGRRLYAIGNSEWVAKLSGVRTGRVVIGAYVLSGLCAAIMGLLLAGFTGQTFLDMGRPYLLASIAVVILGGTSISGGRGHYIGILGGALLFTALGSMFAGTSLPEAVRVIVYGTIILGAVILLREKWAV